MIVDARPYQREAVHGGRGYPGVYGVFRRADRALLVLPTGCGKTIVFCQIAEDCAGRGRRVLIVAHRRELIEQAAEKLVAATGLGALDVGVEMAGARAGDHHRVVVGSVQTLHRRRLERLDPEEFGLVVIDEAHHAPAKSYSAILEHFAGHAKVLGVTATPRRMDGRSVERLFGELAYHYSIGDAVDDGWLVPITARLVMDGSIDLGGVRTTAGDFNLGDLAAVMEARPALALVAKAVLELAGERPTLIFAVSVAQAHAIAAHLDAARPGCAAAVDGTSPADVRAAAVDCLRRGDVQFLCNCALFTEGVDLPMVSCVAVARPTQSQGLYCQMVGRGTRLLGRTIEESRAAGKADMLILDFAGATIDKRLVSAFDVVDAGDDEESRRRAMRRAAREAVDVRQALDQASLEIVEEARAQAVREATYHSVEVGSPYTILGVRPRRGREGVLPASREQLALLARHKIPGAEQELRRLAAGETLRGTFDRGQAAELGRAIADRVRRGLCSVRQARTLMRWGLNPDAPFDAAGAAMRELEAAKWRPTPELLRRLRAMPGLAPEPKGEATSTAA